MSFLPASSVVLVAAMRAPLSSVGVIGGGVAGLSCARRLQEHGLDCTVFDTGKQGPGGRCSSRLWGGGGTPADHAAQFTEARSEEYREFLAELERDGSAFKLPPGSVGHLRRAGGAVEPLADDDAVRYCGVGGMGALTRAASTGLDIRQDVWVSPSNGIWQGSDGVWHVKESKSTERRFDALVIAHNGKCAERLTSRQPAHEIHQLLRARFASHVGRGGNGSGRMTLNSIYSLLFEVPRGTLPASLGICTFVHCEPALRFLGNNHAKHGGPADAPTEVWTALSSAAFGKQHKHPQDFLEGSNPDPNPNPHPHSHPDPNIRRCLFLDGAKPHSHPYPHTSPSSSPSLVTLTLTLTHTHTLTLTLALTLALTHTHTLHPHPHPSPSPFTLTLTPTSAGVSRGDGQGSRGDKAAARRRRPRRWTSCRAHGLAHLGHQAPAMGCGTSDQCVGRWRRR